MKVRGSNPSTVYWMDIFSHIFVVKLYCLFEKTKISGKEAGDGPFFEKKTLEWQSFMVSNFATLKLCQHTTTC